MKAPTDKLNDIIQVVITRRCTLNCSNCTQLLPFRRDAPNMSPSVFRDAVRSLRDWPGIVGIFGGNPPCHPQFEELMATYCEEIPDQRHRGLWANDLLKHGELCRDVFYPHGRFNLNAHADPRAAAEIERWLPGKLIPSSRRQPSRHGAILVDRKDYGLSDEEWVFLRERCDINRHWSAAIVERNQQAVAYFCEVAGALDGVRRENHGVPVEPGWWRWKMGRFESQVRQCCDRGCGVPLRLQGHVDREEIYDVSPNWSVWTGETKRVSTKMHGSLPTEHAAELTDYMRLRS